MAEYLSILAQGHVLDVETIVHDSVNNVSEIAPTFTPFLPATEVL